MQAFLISAARHLDAVTGRLHGLMFADRNHARAGLAASVAYFAYVLDNWQHHGADRDTLKNA